MPFQREEIIRVARSMIADFGELAEEEAESRTANSEFEGRVVTARLWYGVKIAINEINLESKTMAENRGEPE